jgi:MiaB-like tRNA modifying enzyme
MSKLKDFSIAQNEKEAHIIVINSCTVTNSADSGVRNYINKIKRETNAKIYLTGCGAFTKGEELLKENKVLGVFGHSEKTRVSELLKREKFFELGDLNHIDDTIVERFIGKSRAFVKIQEGCNFRCSYCIIPYVRGDARSLSEKIIIEQVSRLAANGFGEFILTGTNVGSYGRDRKSSLAALLKKISRIRGVKRVRIGSLEPIQIDDEFMELLNEKWMAKHLHIALQHTSDKMLEIMNRRNRFSDDCRLFEKLASYGYALGTDFIVGHPGEGKREWDEAMRRIDMMPLTHIHAFTYSRRDGTVSAQMKECVPGDTARRRHRELVEKIRYKNYLFRKKHQTDLTVLVEKRDAENYQGYDQYYNRIVIESDYDLSGSWIQIGKAEIKSGGNYVFI